MAFVDYLEAILGRTDEALILPGIQGACVKRVAESINQSILEEQSHQANFAWWRHVLGKR